MKFRTDCQYVTGVKKITLHYDCFLITHGSYLEVFQWNGHNLKFMEKSLNFILLMAQDTCKWSAYVEWYMLFWFYLLLQLSSQHCEVAEISEKKQLIDVQVYW